MVLETAWDVTIESTRNESTLTMVRVHLICYSGLHYLYGEMVADLDESRRLWWPELPDLDKFAREVLFRVEKRKLIERVVGTVVIFTGGVDLDIEYHANYLGLCSYR